MKQITTTTIKIDAEHNQSIVSAIPGIAMCALHIDHYTLFSIV